MNFIERPLTLPAGVLSPQLEFQAQHIPGTEVPNSTLGQEEYKTAINVGAAIGITPNFELAGTFLPIQLSPEAQYGSPSAQATFRFAKQRGFEMGARVKTTFNTVQVVTEEQQPGRTIVTRSPHLDSATIEAGFPLLLRFNRQARFDTGLYALFTVGKEERVVQNGILVDQSRTIVGMKIPADLSVALHHQVYMGAGTGINVEDFNSTGSSLSIPFRVFAGFTVGQRRNPMLEINPYFAWDRLITPGQQQPTTTTTTQQPAPTGGANQQADTKRVVNNPSSTTVPQDTFHSNDWRFGVAFKGFIHFL